MVNKHLLSVDSTVMVNSLVSNGLFFKDGEMSKKRSGLVASCKVSVHLFALYLVIRNNMWKK